MWLKYSDAPINLADYADRKQRPLRDDGYRSDYEKPLGCWITDDSEHCWRDWCVSARFDLERLTHKHEVVLDESNILILPHEYALDDFTAEYGGDCWWGPDGEPRKYRNRYIDWHKVATRYDGLIITPYLWQRRMELNWYYTWDCASGVVWNIKAIKAIRLIGVDMEIAKPRESEAA